MGTNYILQVFIFAIWWVQNILQIFNFTISVKIRNEILIEYFYIVNQCNCYQIFYRNLIFFLSGFSFKDTDDSQNSRGREGGDHRLFHSATSTGSRTLRHLFATLHARWLSRIFNRNACVYQTTTRWDLPSYRITVWLIDWWCNVCLFT